MLSILILVAINVILISVIAKFLFSEGEVFTQTVHDYNYDEVEHANYWNAENVSRR